MLFQVGVHIKSGISVVTSQERGTPGLPKGGVNWPRMEKDLSHVELSF